MADKIKLKLMPITLILSGVEGLVLLATILLTKSVEGGIIFGLSIARLAMAAVVMAGVVVMVFLGLRWHSQGTLVNRLKKAFEDHTINIVFLLFWAFVLFSFLQAPIWYQIIFASFKLLLSPQLHPQLRPLLIWIAAVLIQLALGLTFSRKNKLASTPPGQRIFLLWALLGISDLFSGNVFQNLDKKHWQSFWRTHKTSLLVFLGMLASWAGIAITGVGLTPDTKFWNIAGIPILWHQVVFTILLVVFLLDISNTDFDPSLEPLSKRTIFPIFVIILIWAAAILIWQAEPLRHTYFSPGPYPPNYVKYPFSDARWFDTGGQYFLMGEGLNNNHLTDRPYLMLLHAFLHMLGGQNYDQIAFFQIILLAILPACLFLIGWKLDSKIAGLAIAVLYILKEKNAIEGAFKIGLVNAKTLTSELPSAFLLILITICLINWFRQEKPRIRWPILAGGLAGLAIGIRGNSLTIIPLTLLLALLVYLRERTHAKQWILASVFFLVGAAAVLSPYSIDNLQNYGSPFWLLKVQNVIQRSDEELISLQASVRNQKLVRLAESEIQEASLNSYASLAVGHFVHNEIATVLMLPINWQAVPIDDAIGDPIWDLETPWQGKLTTGEEITLGINLLILAFGIGYALRQWGITGLVPLAIHLTYNLTSGAAQTSGGRYLVPTDWVMILYFVLGILQFIRVLRGGETRPTYMPPSNAPASHGIILPVLSLLGFMLIGSSFLLSGLISQPFELGSREAYWEYLEAEKEKLADIGIEISQIETFLKEEDAVFNLGLALYPRYYEAGEETQVSSHLPLIPADDARLYFLMLEEKNPRHVSIILNPDEPAPAFPHGAYGLILGCRQDDYTQGKTFIPLNAPESNILTEGNLALNCD